jgi:hypothetical protein
LITIKKSRHPILAGYGNFYGHEESRAQHKLNTRDASQKILAQCEGLLIFSPSENRGYIGISTQQETFFCVLEAPHPKIQGSTIRLQTGRNKKIWAVRNFRITGSNETQTCP